MGKKRIYVALCLIALAMLGICFFYLKKTGWGMTGDKAWNELLDLDKNITLEQLEAKGYINVTGCLDEENETISEFIDNAGNRRPAVLRLTSNENDDLCAKILLYDKEYNAIGISLCAIGTQKTIYRIGDYFRSGRIPDQYRRSTQCSRFTYHQRSVIVQRRKQKQIGSNIITFQDLAFHNTTYKRHFGSQSQFHNLLFQFMACIA